MSESKRKQERCRLYETVYVPKLSHNLPSVSRATRSGKSFTFTESCCQLLDEKQRIVATGSKVGNKYYLNCIKGQGATHTATACSSGNTKEIWHRCFGHHGANNLQKTVKEQLDYDVIKDINFCEPCVDGKHRLPFPKSGEKQTTQLLKIVLSDICGKIEAKLFSEAEYFVTFIDDESKFVWIYRYIYILKNKGGGFKKLMKWKTMVENSSDQKIKTLYTDNGREYISREFKDYLRKEGIRHERTVPKIPE